MSLARLLICVVCLSFGSKAFALQYADSGCGCNSSYADPGCGVDHGCGADSSYACGCGSDSGCVQCRPACAIFGHKNKARHFNLPRLRHGAGCGCNSCVTKNHVYLHIVDDCCDRGCRKEPDGEANTLGETAKTLTDDQIAVVYSQPNFQQAMPMAMMPMMPVMPVSYQMPMYQNFNQQSTNSGQNDCSKDLQTLASKVDDLAKEVDKMGDNVVKLAQVSENLAKATLRHDMSLEVVAKRLDDLKAGTTPPSNPDAPVVSPEDGE